ncbi:MAG TPA: energy transducer TonB [Rhizomicrobium sp.]|nr:energy transducer TonB [Rhizomicrobium sp.]
MEQPLHTIRSSQPSLLSPQRLPALIAATAIVIGFAWALSVGLAQRVVEKGLEEIKIDVLKEKIEKKEPPPPPPEMKAPPPPFVPPPDIVIQTEAPPPTNTITTQSQVKAPPAISSPASIGRPHVCLQDYPAISVRLGEQGTTTLAFTITAEGTVENVHVANSSGSERLDNAAVDCAARWRYKPAIEKNNPVAVPWKAEVKWVLH